MRERSYLLTMVVLAAAMFAGLWISMEAMRRSALAEARAAGAAVAADPAAGSRPRPAVQVAALLRSLNLITVELRTQIASSRLDESWRGDVRARVEAPVRLLYGCDLSGVAGLGESAGRRGAELRPNLLSDGYTLRVPRPVRLAVEIDGERQRSDVEVGWGRFRDLAGEYQLGLARTGLYEEARRSTLSDAQREQVEQTTREQLTALVRALAAGGQAVPVEIEFFDPSEVRSDYVSAPDDPAGGRVGP